MSKKIICRDLEDKKFEVDSDQLIYRPSVYGVLIKDGKVLLSKQWDGYDLPGGGMYIHESIEDTLKREFFEETGLKVEMLQPVHCETSFFRPTHSPKFKHQYWNCPLMYFLVKEVGGELSIDHFDEEEQNYADMPEWIDVEKLEGLKFYNSIDTMKVIKKALEII